MDKNQIEEKQCRREHGRGVGANAATGNISPSQLPSGSVQVCQETQSTISCSPSIIVIVHSKLDPGRLFYCRCGWQRLTWLLEGCPQVAKALEDDEEDARWQCAQVKGARQRASLKSPQAIAAILKFTIWFCVVSDFHSFSLTRGKYRTFGGMSLLEWKSRWEKGPKGWMRNSHSLI